MVTIPALSASPRLSRSLVSRVRELARRLTIEEPLLELQRVCVERGAGSQDVSPAPRNGQRVGRLDEVGSNHCREVVERQGLQPRQFPSDHVFVDDSLEQPWLDQAHRCDDWGHDEGKDEDPRVVPGVGPEPRQQEEVSLHASCTPQMSW